MEKFKVDDTVKIVKKSGRIVGWCSIMNKCIGKCERMAKNEQR